MKIFFSADKTFYSLCPNLEGIKDILCKHSGLVRTVEPRAQIWWCSGGHGNAFCVSTRRKERSYLLALSSETIEPLTK